MSKFRKFLKISALLLLLGLFSGIAVIASTYFYLKPELPSMEALQDVRFQLPLRVYTRDQKLIAEFGEKRRTPIKYEEVPDTFVKAVMAAEDQNFFKHSGIDIKGLSRAVVLMIQNMGSVKGGGGSTITMQLTRALFLSKDRTFKRKFKEIILAIQLENELSKEEIMELYFNEIYLGKRAYGIQAAANVYYNKNIDELSLAQQAMIAGLPKAPATNNPVNNPKEAIVRRDWILGRMLELNFISKEQYTSAINEDLSAKDHGQANEVEAPYVAEMIRKQLYDKYGDAIYTEGYKAYATILAKEQTAANRAVNLGIHEYNERHGFKGVIRNVENEILQDLLKNYLEENRIMHANEINRLPKPRNSNPEEEIVSAEDFYNLTLLTKILREADTDFSSFFSDIPEPGKLQVATCLLIDDEKQTSIMMFKDLSVAFVKAEDILWAAPYIDRNTIGDMPEKISQVLKQGDVVYLRKNQQENWRLAQLPKVQSALVAMNPIDGAVISLVGGYDYNSSKYNRATQGGRQAGSSFKPFIYTKAFEGGFTAATVVNDAPVVFEDKALESKWKPENAGGNFYGPTLIRQALYRSRNLVSIRVLRKIGVSNAIESMERFGFNREQLPDNLSLALGSASLNTMEIATGFSVFANGGHRIYPYLLAELHDADGDILFKANPTRVCIDGSCEPEELLTEIDNREANEFDFSGPFNEEAKKVDAELITRPSEEETALEIKIAEPVIEPRVNYIVDSILADVIKRGTGRRALALGRKDIRGKTGTTNDQFDAWFTGYNNDLVTSVWVGFDSPETLGRGEYGAVAALPIWLYFMEQALEGKEEKVLSRPDGLITVKINAKTGEAALPGDADAIFEIFREEFAPKLDQTQTRTPIQDDEIEPGFIF